MNFPNFFHFPIVVTISEKISSLTRAINNDVIKRIKMRNICVD